MDSSSASASRFRFRDHVESSEGDTTADSSSVSSNEDEELELQSMTARGVQHLCSELVELKQESDEDFQKNISLNYSAFLVILKEIQVLRSELLGLKNQASLQMRLVKDVSDGISLQVLSEEMIDSMFDEAPPVLTSVETHAADISETLYTLLSEHRLDHALAILEMDSEFIKKFQSDEYSSDQRMSYSSIISEKRAMLVDQLTSIAKHSRVSAPELQQALFGLCRLGQNHLANKLLFQYYHTRIESGIHDLQSTKGFLAVVHIQEAAKLICSMISQGVRSFIALNGETYPYASELTQWTTQEIEVFSVCFSKFVESMSDISGRLSTAVDALQITMSYCSLLEAQRIMLRPPLIECLRPCLEEVLRLHIDHLGKVVSIVTSTDTWVLGRYYASGILTGRSYAIIDKQQEYFFLTDSDRKFVTLFQSVVEDVSPLIALQMEGSVLKGITELFTSYVVLLEISLIGDTDVTKRGDFRINLPEVPSQGVFILANVSTLMQFCSSIIRNIFDGIHQLDIEINNYITFLQDVYGRLKTCFLDQFILNIFPTNADHESDREGCISSHDGSRISDLTPSIPYLELYLELKRLEKAAEDELFDKNWLTSLLKEAIDATFGWVWSQFETWGASEVDGNKLMQIILDTQFVVEIARRGEYLSDYAVNISKDIRSRLESSSTAAGLRDLNEEEWAGVALEKLQQLDATEWDQTLTVQD